jgi:uncharacterized Zn-binding protein involved in type VI secretion
MPPAARISDIHICPAHGLTPVVGPGAPLVLIGGLPAVRILDLAVCPGGNPIVKGAAFTLISFLPAARMGDPTAHGGTVLMGLPTVLIGGAPMPPLMNQGAAMSCGLAVVRMVIFDKTGKVVPEKQLAEESQNFPGAYDPENGTRQDNMEALLKLHGVDSELAEGASADDVENATANGDPAVVHQEDPAHFVVVDEVRTNEDGSRTVVGRDPYPPGQGKRFEESEEDWNKRKTTSRQGT